MSRKKSGVTRASAAASASSKSAAAAASFFSTRRDDISFIMKRDIKEANCIISVKTSVILFFGLWVPRVTRNWSRAIKRSRWFQLDRELKPIFFIEDK